MRSVASALLGLLLALTGCAPTRGERQEMVLTVKWHPDRVSGSEIRIESSVAGLPPLVRHDTLSPWDRTIAKTSKEMVYLEAHQRTAGTLECFIHHNGKQLVTDRIDVPGSVSCGVNGEEG